MARYRQVRCALAIPPFTGVLEFYLAHKSFRDSMPPRTGLIHNFGIPKAAERQGFWLVRFYESYHFSASHSIVGQPARSAEKSSSVVEDGSLTVSASIPEAA